MKLKGVTMLRFIPLVFLYSLLHYYTQMTSANQVLTSKIGTTSSHMHPAVHVFDGFPQEQTLPYSKTLHPQADRYDDLR